MIELRDVLSPELVAAIERLVDERVEARLSELATNGTPSSPWLDRQAAAEYLRVSAPTIDRLRRLGRLTPDHAGRKPLFHRDELDTLARSGRTGL